MKLFSVAQMMPKLDKNKNLAQDTLLTDFWSLSHHKSMEVMMEKPTTKGGLLPSGPRFQVVRPMTPWILVFYETCVPLTIGGTVGWLFGSL